MIMNGKVQVLTHDTATIVTEAAECTAEISMCECMVITDNGNLRSLAFSKVVVVVVMVVGICRI